MANEINPRQIIKISSVTTSVPTIGPSLDFKDGTWGVNDIYEGELYLNSVDEKLWIGGVAAPIELGLVGGGTFLPLTGGTMSGNIEMGVNNVQGTNSDNSINFNGGIYLSTEDVAGVAFEITDTILSYVHLTMDTERSIISSNGGGQIDLDYGGAAGNVFISTDGGGYGQAGLDISDTYGIGLFANNGGDQSLLLGSVANQMALRDITNNLGIAFNPQALSAADTISLFKSTSDSTTSIATNNHVFINSHNGFLASGADSSVMIGGVGLTGSNSNTVYVPNLNIQSGKSIIFDDCANSGIDNIVSGLGCTSSGNYTLVTGKGNDNTSNESILAGTFNSNAGSRNIIVASDSHIGASSKSGILASELCDIGNGGNNLAILGSKSSTINNSLNRSVIIGGQSITASKNDTVYVPDLTITKSHAIPVNNVDPIGETGGITWDTNYIYIKTAFGWKRSAISTF